MLPIAIVYGIAVTAMSFFTDPTISTLTSGPPSQNVDIGGFSFPRRLGVRMNPDFMMKYHLKGLQARWQAYSDPNFKESLGKDFYHEDTVSTVGWARFYFDGIFPKDTAYLKLEIVNMATDFLVKTFYFKFTKSYLMTLDGRSYLLDPVLDEKIVKNGYLEELRPFKRKDGTIVYKKAKTQYKTEKVLNIEWNPFKSMEDTDAILMTSVSYTEKSKMLFLVTPPHMMEYAKLVLIFVKQLVDYNFSVSYLTKSSQKPLYKTRYMLDELGNLQSEGHGINSFATLLSIGLGQEQQFTIILQTLQQLRDVYGDSVDKIVQGNTSNIVFLKSTDETMIDTMVKMSGTTHKVYQDSKTVTRDMAKLVMPTEGKVSYTQTAREVPVISYNDFAFISPSNSIVFRAGDSVIWNRNGSVLPMAWCLFKNTIKQPGKDYNLQTLPTLSQAMHFDVRKNQPDFMKMFDKRLDQAIVAKAAYDMYQNAYGYSDYEMQQLDPDNMADEIMEIIANTLVEDMPEKYGEDMDLSNYESMFDTGESEENKEVMQEVNKLMHEKNMAEKDFRFAQGKLRPMDLNGKQGINRQLEGVFMSVYGSLIHSFADDPQFMVKNRSLYTAKGTLLIKAQGDIDAIEQFEEAARDANSRIYDEGGGVRDIIDASYIIMDSFFVHMSNLKTWKDICDGDFDAAVAAELDN